MNLVKMETVIAYKYRIYPTKSQVSRLENQFSMCRHLYNWNIEERINAYDDYGETISYSQQQNALPGLKKERPWFKFVHFQVLQDVLRRLDRAYNACFCRVKQRIEVPGFFRIKKPGAWYSITYPQYKERPAVDHIKVSKIGDIKIRYHRDIPNNTKIKTLTISKETGKWFACFSFKGIISNEPKLETYSRSLGIDMGLIDFLYDSDGYCVPVPKHLRQSENKLKRLQPRLSRAKAQNDWPRIRKLQKALAKCHYRVKFRRNDFLHKTANDLLARADLICFENLNIRSMLRRPWARQDEATGHFLPNGASAKAGLNKSIADAGWGKFLSTLKYKTPGLGKEVIAVKPHYTSQKRSGFGEIIKKSLSVRTHQCSQCGLVLNRDHNAAINILTLGLQSQGCQAQQALTKTEGHPCGIAVA